MKKYDLDTTKTAGVVPKPRRGYFEKVVPRKRYTIIVAGQTIKKLFITALMALVPAISYADIEGTVFRDFSVNGITLGIYGDKHATEPGVEGVTVTAYDPAGVALPTVVTDAAGAYTLLTAVATDYRVEFSAWPTYLKESPEAGLGNTSVQFVDHPGGGLTDIDFGLHNPADYTNTTNPDVVSTIFVNGAADAGTLSDQGGLVKWDYTAVGTGGDASEEQYANESEVGSVWGIAHDKQRAKIYAATMVKRHVGVLDNALGRIYEVNDDGTGTPATFIDIPDVGTIATDAVRGLGAAGDESRDPEAVGKALKAGLGDIDITDDQSTLYAMNLFDRKLYEIDVASKTISASFDSPNPCDATEGEHRPFAVEAVDDKVFIGVVCDASVSGLLSDLTAHVYEFDGTNFTSIYQHTLDYAREATPDNIDGWHVWSDDYEVIAELYNQPNTFWRVVNSQPVLADIKFDDAGNLIVGFMDRVGFQGGFENLPIAGVPFEDNLEFKTISGGDVLLATPDGTGQYIVNPADANADLLDESINADDSPLLEHQEAALGALAILKGSGEVAMIKYDPVGNNIPSFHTAGVTYFNQAGDETRAYRVLDNTVPMLAHFGKGAGMGDIEILTTLAPVEIGNRVWLDTDGDGVQDADEAGIAGVRVELLDDTGTLITFATSDANGNYIFSNDANGTTTASYIYDITSLTPDTAYTVRIPDVSGGSTQAALGTNLLTLNDIGEGADANLNDSDGDLNLDDADAPVAAIDIPLSGANNHSFDFGFVPSVSLGSVIWNDANNNGTQDADEEGIAGAVVTLLDSTGAVYDSDPVTTGVQALTQTTLADGNYFFDGIPVGDYQVQADMTAVPGFVPSTTQVADPEDNVNGDSNIATTTGQVYTSGTITLTAGEEPTGVDEVSQLPNNGDDTDDADADTDAAGNMTLDFGFVSFVSLGSNVWLDTNLDGVQDAGEIPIEGATMTLLIGDGTVYDSDPSTPAIDALTAITDANGQYFFNDLIEGDYIVQLDASTSSSHPGKLFPTPPQIALPNNDSNTDSNVDILNAGHDPVTELYFSGVVTLEAGTEPTAELNPLTATADQPGQTAAQLDASGNMTVDFGLVEYVSIGSTVWIDSDGNGLQDAGEPPIAGAMVTLMNADGLTAYDSDPTTAAIEPLTVFTDADGQYNFNQLPPGTYRVQVDLRTVLGGTALVPTLIQVDDPENDDNTDSNIDVNAVGAVPALQIYQSGPITLQVGDEPASETDPIGAGGADQPNQTAEDLDDSGNMTVDFGFVKPMSIGSYVWEDTSLDGLQDAGEPGINDATVNLLVEDADPNSATFGDFIPAVDLNNDPVPATTTATVGADDGVYLFDNLPPGNYKVQVSDIPAGFVPSGSQTTGDDNDTDNDSNIASEPVTGTFESGEFALVVDNEPLAAAETQPGDSQDDTDADSEGNGNMTIDFGFVPTVSIGSFVWEDNGSDGAGGTTPANIANGIQDADEPAIEGVSVSLLVDDGAGTFIPATDAIGAVVADQVTDTDGFYYFDNLPEGAYKVQVTPPAQFVPTVVQNTADDDTDNDSNIASEPVVDTTYESGEFTLELGTEPDTAAETQAGDDQDDLVETGGNMTVDFGFIQPVSIGSYVWQDTNGNGLQDAGEPAITEGTVSLVDANGDPVNDIDGNPVADIDLADNADGQYIFDNLVPGDYKVQVTPLDPDYVPTPIQSTVDDDVQNDSNIASEPTPDVTYESPLITLTAGSELVETAGEAGDDQDTASPESDASGDMTIDFGFVKPLSIGSYVWEDSNGDGTQDAAEVGINDVTVSLLVEDPASPGDFIPAVDLDGTAVADVTTGNDGTDNGVYLFDNLPPGNYKVQAKDLPDGFIPSGTQTTADDDDVDADSNIADEPDPGVFESGVFTLEVDGEPLSGVEGQPGDAQDDSDPADGSTESNGNMTIDFGFVQAVSIGSYVWEDNGADGGGGTTAANVANGIQDADEPPLEGALIALLVDDGTGTDTFVPASDIDGVLVADQTTLADGLYFFDNLPEGIYKVQVTPPAPFKPTLVQNDADDDDTANDSNIALETAAPGTYESGVFTLEYGLEPDAAAETEVGDDQDDLVETGGNMTVDFGFIQPVSIGSYVWEDTNGNGLQDDGEPAITEGMVTLVDVTGLAVTDIDGNPVLPIDLATLADGQYIFDNLAPGIYKVQVTPVDPDYVPTPIQSTVDDDVQNDSNIASEPTPDVTYESPLITLTAGSELVETAGEAGDDQDTASPESDASGDMTIDFGFVKPLSIGSYVWEDSNGDGTQDAAEVGISDVTVSLLVEDPASPGDFIPAVDLDGTAVADVTTGNDGTDNGVYLFDNLPPGNYKVQAKDLPDGFVASSTQTAGDDNVDNDSNIATEPTPGVVFESGIIALGVDQEPLSDDEGQPSDTQDDSDPADGNTESNGNMTIDFGFVQPVSIGSYVWEDNGADGGGGTTATNVANGIQDANEPPLEGVLITLLVDDGSGTDTFEPASDIDGDVVADQTTPADGLYFFDNLPEGIYKVQVTPPAPFKPTLVQNDADDDDTANDSNIALETAAPGTYEGGVFTLEYGLEPDAAAETEVGDDQDDLVETGGNMTVDFGFIQPVSIGSYVWEDTNGNGLQDDGEPAITEGMVTLVDVTGLAVTDIDGNPVLPIDLATLADGQYIFDNLAPGIYKVQVTPVDPDYVPTPIQSTVDDDVQNDSNIASEPTPDVTYESPLITLTAGSELVETAGEAGDDQDTASPESDASGDMTIDFGFVKPLSIGSYVWEDSNGDGTQDAAEVGINDVTVSLLVEDPASPGDFIPAVDLDGTAVADVTTGNDGTDNGVYLFDNLPPGNYKVQAKDLPDGFIASSTQTAGDDNVDNDSNIATEPTPGVVFESGIIALGVDQEPLSDDEGQPGDTQDDSDPADGNTESNGNMTIDFGFVQAVSIGSYVWEDNGADGGGGTTATNVANGIQDANEPPLEGVLITLLVDDGSGTDTFEPASDIDGDVVADQTMPADGLYFFDNLPEGIYKVQVTPPAPFKPTLVQNDADDDDTANDSNIALETAAPGTYESGVFTLEYGLEPDAAAETEVGDDQDDLVETGGNMTVDFGFIQPVSIGSYVWEDTNGNGLQDDGEPAITEGMVTLVDVTGLAVTDIDGNPVLPIDLATLADGQYIFDNLAPGIYKVQVTPVDPDYVPTPIQSTVDDDVQNDSNIASEPTPDVTYESPLITLTAGSEPVETAGEAGDDQDDASPESDASGDMTIDFGFVKPLSIGSYVWEDSNGDGTQDAAEVGISDVTVSLLVEDPASPGDFIPAVDLDGTAVADVTTGNDGTDNGVYLFDNLPPGNYKVQAKDLPDGFIASSTQTAGDDNVDNDSNIATEPTPGVVFESGIIALGVDQEPLSDDEGQPGDAQDDSDPADGSTESNGNMTIDFGFFQIQSIGSYAWEDLDVDGVQDDTEPAIEGAEVVLLVEDAANPGTFIPAVDIDGVAVDPQTTDVDGLYYFDMLPEGTYKVQVTPPAIFVPTLVQTDGDDADTTPADELDSNIADEPVAGTYESGAFELMAGDEPTESGDATGDDQDDEMETSGNMTVDFGFIQPVSIGSYVWEDTNGDGLQDATEPAITAGTVELFNADGTPVTDLDGNLVGPVDLSTTGGLYIFDNLIPGDYKVRVTPEDTTLLISPNQEPGDDDTENDSNIDVDSGAPDGSFESGVFTLTPGTEPTEGAEVGDDQDDDGTGIAAEDAGNMTVDFGFVQPVSLGSTVFFDNNNNGVQDDTDAGIPGVTVTLYEADGETPVAGVDPVLTDDDGNYFFDGLLPGDYVVGVMAPTDAPTSSDGAGGDDQTDSDDNGIQDAPGDETLSEVITLLAGDEPEGDDEDGQGGDQDDDAIATDDAGDMTIDFGFVPPVSIGSTVFFDNDDNGMQGDDETGIPGVTVTLYQEVNGVLEPVPDVPPVVTDDEGNYLFEDLLPGIYVVGVIPLDHSPTSSTSDGSDDQVDSDDNGIQTASGDEAFSSPIDLEAGTEPEGESGQGGDQDADADDAGDMSVDFGFVPLPSDISLIKTRTDGYPIDLGDGSWRVRFDFEVENTGEVELTEVQIVDDLIAMLNSNAINDGVISEVELESPDMTLSPSPSYDGVGDTNMLDGTDVMSVGEIGHLQLTFKFTAAQFFGPFMNMGDVTGMPPNRVPEEDEDDAVVEVFDTEKPITLGWFSSSDQGNGEVIFEWSTQTEIGNVGYYLWSRAEGGQWSQLNEDMIVSQGDSLEEQVYQYRAFTAGDAFRLTDVSMSGKEVHHGPYQLGEQAGVRIERHPTDWDSIQRQSDEKQRAREQQRRDEMQRRLQQLQGSIDHKPALGLMSKAGLVMANLAGALISPAHALEMANFDVDAAGVYRVTHAQLVAAGLDLEGYASNRIGLKMANALAPLKILPLSSDTFGAGSSIEFPALGVDTLYAGSNVYTLVLDEGQNLIQADERTIPSGPPAYSYMAEVVHAPQNVYAHFSPDESDAWYAYRMDALNNNSASKSVSLSVTDHALAFHTSGATSDSRQIASKKPRLEVKLWGASTLAGDGEAEPDHHVTVSINGGEVADERFDGIRKHVLSKPLAQINSGSNTIKVDLPNDHSYPFDRVDIDSVKLLYPRQFKADDSGRSLVFPSSWNKFLLQKLSSTDVVVYRLDSDGNADQMMQHEGNCDAGAGNCIVSFAGVMSEADDSAVYFVSTEAGIKQPQIAMAPPHEALFDGEAKMLVIAHPDFIGTSLSTLEGYTASMAGIYGSSDLVNVESIYAQYSGQVMDANAVHQYIIDAVATRGTEHVMLVGGDMYDYRNNLGTSAKSFVPSLYIQTGQNQSTVPSDPKYADVDGDDIPDIDIARLPVRTEAELEVLLSKRQSYLSRSYTGSAVFSADKTDETGNDFDVTSEQWVSDYFSGWNVDRAYIDNMGSGAKQVVRDGINAGASLTSYTGHSSTVSWSFDDLFNSDDVSALTNAGKPTVVAQWGCWNTFYSSPEQESIAQKFLVEGDKGAVVVMGATSLGGADTEDAMADLLYARLSQGMRIGDAVLSAKRAFAEAFPGRLDMLLGWTVLGPADLTVN